MSYLSFRRTPSTTLLATVVVSWVWVSGMPSAVQGQAPPAVSDTVTGINDTLEVFRLDPLTVRGRIDDLAGRAATASVGFVGFRDLRMRPLSREAELLETVPGMILTQHSGSGKSNQMFVRGFNLDHGTDFSTRIEGMPVNVPSHAHGQGYTDLNFIVPEFIDHIEYTLGNYYAQIGDFGSAGGAHMRLRRTLERPLFSAGVGEHGYQRIVAAAPARIGARGTLMVGGEYKGYDGPWERPEDLNKLSGMARYTWQGTASSLSLLALGYDNRWDATDQIPLRGVESGLVDRFGQIDPTLGGTTSRYSVSGAWNRATGRSSQTLEAYAIHYDLDLFSNFTYLLDDNAAGDQIRQREDGRWTLGANFAHVQPFALWGIDHAVTVGMQLREDRADVALDRTSGRTTIRGVRSDRIAQRNAGFYAEVVSRWLPQLRSTVGLRGDLHGFDVASDLSDNSGTRTDAIVNPKLSVAFEPWSGTEIYASAGLGYHSNDARGTVQTRDPESGLRIEPVDPLVRSTGAELGFRSAPIDGLRSTLSVWTVSLDSELVFVGDAGNTEPSDPSQRSGVTFANFYRIGLHWVADLDVSFTKSRFVDAPAGADRIPGALEDVIAAGLGYEPLDGGVFAALRLRRFGAYPLVEDNSERADANSLLNLNVGYHLGDARLTLSVLNLLNEEHSDIQYFYRSRLAGEPTGGVADLHFHPAEPRQLRVSLAWGM